MSQPDQPSGSRGGLGIRLLGAQLLTIAVGAITLVVVALVAGPRLLDAHLTQVLIPLPPDVRHHLELGYTNAAQLTIMVAGLASLLVAVVVSLVVTRRIVRPVSAVADAASRVAVGDYATRIPDAGLGVEMARLTTAFNVMATELSDTERSRQRLLADLAHELRTPLATIRAYHEALADGVRAPDPSTWAVLDVQTDRIERLISDIALVSRLQEHSLPLEPVDIAVSEFVESAAASARPGYEAKGVSLTTHLASGLPMVRVDPDRIGQVVANLLTNALRHTPADGHVEVITRNADESTHSIEIRVRDSGDGLGAEELPHVFERFYRADAARDRGHGGTGIGLTIARALVHAQHGTLTAASSGLGLGAEFTIALPPSPL